LDTLKTKILFLIDSFPSQKEIPVLNQVSEVERAGYDVSIYTFDNHLLSRTDLPSQIHQYKLNEKIKTLGRPQLNLYPNPIINKALITFRTFPVVTKLAFKKPSAFLKIITSKKYAEFKKAFKIHYAALSLLSLNKSFDIIHCQFAPLGIWGAIFKDLKLIEGKLLVSFRGYGINDLPKQKPAGFYNFLIQTADAYTSNTQFTRRNAIHLGFPADKITVIHSSLDVSKYKFKSREYNPAKTLNILTVAALKEVKGIEYAIRALALLKEQSPQVKIKYTITGNGPDLEKLNKLINDLHITDRVRLSGFIVHDQLKAIYDETHLFILPSVTTRQGNQEGQGLVIQEAQACGIPVIGTNSGGIPEGFIDNESGFLVKEKDPQDIADKISQFVQNPGLIPKFGARGRKFVESRFDVSVTNKQLFNLYKSLIKS